METPYIINLPPFFKRSSRYFIEETHVSFPWLSSVWEVEKEERRRKRKSFSSVIDAGWRKRVEKAVGPIVRIKRDTHRFPIISVLFTGNAFSNLGKPRPIFPIVSSSPYPPISYIIAEPRQFHWLAETWLLSTLPDLAEKSSNFFVSKILVSVN